MMAKPRRYVVLKTLVGKVCVVLRILGTACLLSVCCQANIAFADKPDQRLGFEIELIRKVIDALALPELSPQRLAEKFGGSMIPTEAAHSWKIVVSAPGVKIYCDGPEQSARVKTIRIYFDLECNFLLKDLVKEYGTYKVIHESKTSSVRFDHVKGSQIQVYAHLFFSKVKPESPVLDVQIRSE